MTILKSWRATHTGLPSFLIRGPGSLMAGDRLIVTVKDGEQRLVSDAAAPADIPIIYTMGSSTVELTRKSPGDGNVILTDLTGRGIFNGIWEYNGDPVDWKSNAVRHNRRIVRFDPHDPVVSGTSILKVPDIGEHAEIERVLTGRSKKWLIATPPTPGIPNPRLILIDSVARRRIGVAGLLAYEISWTEEAVETVPNWGPVVTWGEWDRWGKANNKPGWQNWSYIEVAQKIAGMPK